MKTLNETKNENFKYFCDCVGSQCLKIKKDGEWQKVDFDLGADDAVKIYASGALLMRKTSDYIHIMFVKNNGDILFEAQEYDLNEMEAVVSDINATVYNSGVLEDICFYGDVHHFYYHSYLGCYFHEKDYSTLVKKITEFEKAVDKNYFFNQAKDEKKYTNMILNCLNDENENQNNL